MPDIMPIDPASVAFYLRIIRSYQRMPRPTRPEVKTDDWDTAPEHDRQLLEALYLRVFELNRMNKPPGLLKAYQDAGHGVGTPEWNQLLAEACARMSPAMPAYLERDITVWDRNLGMVSTPRCDYCPVWADREDAEVHARGLFETRGSRIWQTPEGNWAVESWESAGLAMKVFIRDLILGVAKIIFWLAVIALVGWGLSKCGFGSGNCHTEWDGRVNATECD